MSIVIVVSFFGLCNDAPRRANLFKPSAVGKRAHLFRNCPTLYASGLGNLCLRADIQAALRPAVKLQERHLQGRGKTCIQYGFGYVVHCLRRQISKK